MRASHQTSKKRKRRDRTDNNKVQQQQEHGPQVTEGASKNDTQRRTKQEVDRQALKQERARIEGRSLDWQQPVQRRSVRDVVDAPPTLTRAPRGHGKEALQRKAHLQALLTGTTAESAPQKARLPDPVATGGLRRKAVLGDERERAVKAYRKAKEEKIQARQDKQSKG